MDESCNEAICVCVSDAGCVMYLSPVTISSNCCHNSCSSDANAKAYNPMWLARQMSVHRVQDSGSQWYRQLVASLPASPTAIIVWRTLYDRTASITHRLHCVCDPTLCCMHTRITHGFRKAAHWFDCYGVPWQIYAAWPMLQTDCNSA